MTQDRQTLNRNLAQMLKGGVIMDVTSPEQAKIAEEAGEVLIASKNDENLVYESVDLIFHTLLLLAYKGIEIDEVFEEFESRRK